jgi:hypothetical protein
MSWATRFSTSNGERQPVTCTVVADADPRTRRREHPFGMVSSVLQLHEVESLRRSLAMSSSLPEPRIRELIDTCDQLLQERVRIERILRELGPSWNGARRALNDLAKVLKQPATRRDRGHRPTGFTERGSS